MPLHYQHLLALTESINQINNGVLPSAEMQAAHMKVENIYPRHPHRPVQLQFAYPYPYSQTMCQPIARHIARTHPHLPGHPEFKFQGVRVYRVVHWILDATRMAQGWNPLDKTLYNAYFQGEFDAEGKMKDPQDPLLYWQLPIFRPNRRFDVWGLGDRSDPENPEANIIEDYLEKHATTVK